MNTLAIKESAKLVGRTLQKNSPTILTGLAVAGVVTTVVMAVKATPKALEILDQERVMREDYSERWLVPVEKITKKDVVKLTWKCYLPSFLMGGATIAAIIAANSINLRRNAALSGLYGLAQASLEEYQRKVVETIGENKNNKIKDEIAGDRIKKNPPKNNEIIITGKGNTLCYDSLSGRYFKGDIEEIRKTENYINKCLLTDMWVSLNTVYSELGLTPIKMGEDSGWSVDRPLEFRFTSKLTEDDQPCLVLDYMVDPIPRDRY